MHNTLVMLFVFISFIQFNSYFFLVLFIIVLACVAYAAIQIQISTLSYRAHTEFHSNDIWRQTHTDTTMCVLATATEHGLIIQSTRSNFIWIRNIFYFTEVERDKTLIFCRWYGRFLKPISYFLTDIRQNELENGELITLSFYIVFRDRS